MDKLLEHLLMQAAGCALIVLTCLVAYVMYVTLKRDRRASFRYCAAACVRFYGLQRILVCIAGLAGGMALVCYPLFGGHASVGAALLALGLSYAAFYLGQNAQWDAPEDGADPISIADDYLQKGRREKARAALSDGLARFPERADIQARLQQLPSNWGSGGVDTLQVPTRLWFLLADVIQDMGNHHPDFRGTERGADLDVLGNAIKYCVPRYAGAALDMKQREWLAKAQTVVAKHGAAREELPPIEQCIDTAQKLLGLWSDRGQGQQDA